MTKIHFELCTEQSSNTSEILNREHYDITVLTRLHTLTVENLNTDLLILVSMDI